MAGEDSGDQKEQQPIADGRATVLYLLFKDDVSD